MGTKVFNKQFLSIKRERDYIGSKISNTKHHSFKSKIPINTDLYLFLLPNLIQSHIILQWQNSFWDVSTYLVTCLHGSLETLWDMTLTVPERFPPECLSKAMAVAYFGWGVLLNSCWKISIARCLSWQKQVIKSLFSVELVVPSVVSAILSGSIDKEE